MLRSVRDASNTDPEAYADNWRVRDEEVVSVAGVTEQPAGHGLPWQLVAMVRRLYRGATAEDPVHGMYSFVPALPIGDETPRFARPAVRLAGLINPASKQSPRGSKRPLPMSTVRDAWEAIRHQILATGLVLAVKLDTPLELAVNTVVPASRRTQC